MNYFHHYSIKRYTASLLDLFNDIHIKRIENDIVQSDYIIPISFASPQKAFAITEDDYAKYRESKYNVVPRMALSFDGLEKASNRELNKLNQVMHLEGHASSVKYTYNSVSWNMSYTLHILCDTFTDLTVVLEQILPSFNPTYNLKIKEMDFHSEYKTVPLRLMGITTNLDADWTMDDDIRFVTAELQLSIDANLYPPIKEEKIINHVKVNFYDGNEYVEGEL